MVEAGRTGRADIALKGKIRTILLPKKLCRKLLRFAGKQKIASGEIFLTKDGRSLSRQSIWRVLKALCKKAGVAVSSLKRGSFFLLRTEVKFCRASRQKEVEKPWRDTTPGKNWS